MSQRTVVRYSLAFKRQVVAELESGRFASLEAARLHYGIGGAATLGAWVRRLGRNDLAPKVVRVEKPGERDQLKAMAARIRDLEHALAETQMQALLAEGHFRALCEQCGIEDPEAQKKKRHGRPSGTPPPAPGEGSR